MEYLALKIPDVPYEDAADAMQNLNYVTDAVGMVNDGISIVTTVAEVAKMAQTVNIAYDVSEHAGVVGLASNAGKAALAVGVFGIFAQYIGFWLSLAGAHAAAKAAISRDNLLRGLSRGVVLGADGRSSAYVTRNFWQHGVLHYPFYPELNKAARNLHNIGLISGYGQGKLLKGDQQGNFFKDLRSRMTSGDRVYYSGEPAKWRQATWTDYYILCAALFRKHHVK